LPAHPWVVIGIYFATFTVYILVIVKVHKYVAGDSIIMLTDMLYSSQGQHLAACVFQIRSTYFIINYYFV
jgi:hypothetical protein